MDDISGFLKACSDAGLSGPNLVIAGLVLWFAVKHLPRIVESHIALLMSTKDTQEKQTVILTRLDERVGAKLSNHGEAIEHTANGIIAHVDGRPDEAKQLAAKAKEAVK